MTDTEKDGPIQFERGGEPPWMPKVGDSVVIIFGDGAPVGVGYRAVKVVHALGGWRFLLGDGSDVFLDKHITEIQPAAGYFSLAELRAFVDKLCEPAPDDLPTTLSELLAMVELEVNSEYEHAVSAEAALTTVHSEHEAIVQGLRGELAAETEAHRLCREGLATVQARETRDTDTLRGELERAKAEFAAALTDPPLLEESAELVRRNIAAIDGVDSEALMSVQSDMRRWLLRDQQSTPAAESAKVAEGEESLRGYLLELGSAFEMQEGYSFSALTEDIIAYLRNTEGLTAQLKAKLREREAEEERRWSVRYDAACTERDMAEARADELEAKLRERDIERGAVSSIVQAHGSLVRGLLLNECQSARDSSQLPRQLQLTSVLTLWQRLMDAERDALRSQPSPSGEEKDSSADASAVRDQAITPAEPTKVEVALTAETVPLAAGSVAPSSDSAGGGVTVTSATGEAKPAEPDWTTCYACLGKRGGQLSSRCAVCDGSGRLPMEAAPQPAQKPCTNWNHHAKCSGTYPDCHAPQPAQKAAERNWFPSPYHVAEAARSARHDELEPADPAPPAEVAVAPIPMFLTCPACTCRHIDEGEFATKIHHTHSCQECGLTWRPAVVPTVGVQFLPGFKNQTADELAEGQEGGK